MTDRLCSFRVSVRRVLIVVLGVPTCFCIGIPSARGGNLIANGSFESYGGTGFPSNIGAGLPGWTIQGGPNFTGVDIVDSRNPGSWQAQDGFVSISLNWNEPSSITQTIPTTPGQQYSLSFWMAAEIFWGDFAAHDERSMGRVHHRPTDLCVHGTRA
jgi:hypothetical protein